MNDKLTTSTSSQPLPLPVLRFGSLLSHRHLAIDPSTGVIRRGFRTTQPLTAVTDLNAALCEDAIEFVRLRATEMYGHDGKKADQKVFRKYHQAIKILDDHALALVVGGDDFVWVMPIAPDDYFEAQRFVAAAASLIHIARDEQHQLTEDDVFADDA